MACEAVWEDTESFQSNTRKPFSVHPPCDVEEPRPSFSICHARVAGFRRVSPDPPVLARAPATLALHLAPESAANGVCRDAGGTLEKFEN